ncbi:amidohydrolase family protein [Acrocarpospora sp. B8E8]|uniref:amidohydrolase family protein n=1 Tax=Acrocarpospora sp. B8E8 TaxID=3153572 RepID=UPI00325DBBBA
MTDIVDFRLRPPVGGFLTNDLMYTVPARTAHIAEVCGMGAPTAVLHSRSLQDTIAEMDAAGVALGVVPGRRGSEQGDVPNEDIVKLVTDHPDRFVGYAGIDLTDPATTAQQAQEALQTPAFRGLMLEPGLATPVLAPDDPRLDPLYEVATSRRAPVAIMFGGNAGPDVGFTSPLAIDNLARRHPRLRIILVHGGWPWVPQVIHVAYRRRNIYLEPDIYLFGMAGWRDYVDAGNTYLKDRLLFASDFPYLPLQASVRRFEEMFDKRVLPRLLGENARELLAA